MIRVSSLISRNVFGTCRLPSILVTLRAYSGLRGVEDTKPKLLAREYQLDCVTAILKAFGERKRAAVSLPTGSGKTVIFSMLIPHVEPVSDNGEATKTLIIVPRREIAKQAVEKIKQLNSELEVGLEMGADRFDPDEHDVCVATYQSLSRPGRLDNFDPKDFKLVVIDEAHRSAADSIRQILDHFGVLQKDPPINVVGFSATFWRNDDRQLNDIFDDVVFHRGVNEMIDEGHLSKALLTNITGAFDLQNLSDEERKRGRSQVLRHRDGINLVVRTWKDTWPAYKSTLVFALDLNHVDAIVDAFRREGIDARSVDSFMPTKQRAQLIEAFTNGEYPVLVNYSILSEGTDIPRIDQIILARSLQSELLALQMVGRGLRNFPGKEHCNIVQFAELSRYNGSFDMGRLLKNFTEDLTILEKPAFAGDGELKSNKGANQPEDNLDVSVTADTVRLEQTYFTPEQMFTSDYNPVTPYHSPLCWIEANKQYYLFPSAVGRHLGYFRIGYGPPKGSNSKKKSRAFDKGTKTESKYWLLNFVRPVPGVRHPRSFEKYSSNELSRVIKEAERLAKTAWPYSVFTNLYRSSEWRSRPATEGQVDIIRNKAQGMGEIDELLEEITRGDASSLISLKFIGFQIKPQLISDIVSQARRNYNRGA